jgi:hypothetical protein
VLMRCCRSKAKSGGGSASASAGAGAGAGYSAATGDGDDLNVAQLYGFDVTMSSSCTSGHSQSRSQTSLVVTLEYPPRHELNEVV